MGNTHQKECSGIGSSHKHTMRTAQCISPLCPYLGPCLSSDGAKHFQRGILECLHALSLSNPSSLEKKKEQLGLLERRPLQNITYQICPNQNII